MIQNIHTRPTAEEPLPAPHTRTVCFHCGEDCPDRSIYEDEKYFCCHGCLSVYELLNKAGLCAYYNLNEHAGISRKITERNNKFAFLDHADIATSLIQFKDAGQVHVTFHIPNIHCSSCMYLLQNLHKIAPGVVRCDIQFLKKEVRIIFNEKQISLRKVVETLSAIGYEPHLSLNASQKKAATTNKGLIYRLGVAGFCFGNIMLLSFPEYFAANAKQEQYLGNIFRYLNVALSLPVFFYCANIFFISAWKGFKNGHLNIDVPVALAIGVTFVRSMAEVITTSGGGYFDSMAGIVFFMLAGRLLQDKTYANLSFDRDYTDYFPMAATVITKDSKELPTPLAQLKPGDTIKVHHNELITTDGILVKGKALIDYSFVSGEATPVEKETGAQLFAGGKQIGGAIELLVMRTVSQSYLTGLWNKEIRQKDRQDTTGRHSFVDRLARNFTLLVLAIALAASIYWWLHDPAKIWPSVTSILIIACPCGLLLTSTFTNGYIMRILGKNGLYLRNAGVIETLGKINHLVFDKTGTLTSAQTITASYQGTPLSPAEKDWVQSLAAPSTHALSLPVKNYLQATGSFAVKDFKEFPGLGVSGWVNGHFIRIGTPAFVERSPQSYSAKGTVLVLMIDGAEKGFFELQQGVRPGLRSMLERLRQKISVSLLSGDEPYQQDDFRELLGNKATIRFRQMPDEKLSYIRGLQASGQVVAMTGDGLNDAGALQQSNTGICITEDTNHFTPAGDAILEGKQLHLLDKFIGLCSNTKNIIRVCFGFSLIYNIAGLWFAVQGILSPVIAAILMPASTLSIILLTYFLSKGMSKRMGLQ